MEKLRQLELALPYSPHIYTTTQMGGDLWEKAGRPYCWIVEEIGIYAVFTDVGHGSLALFKAGKLIGIGKNRVITKEVILLDKDYYGVDNSLWTPLVK